MQRTFGCCFFFLFPDVRGCVGSSLSRRSLPCVLSLFLCELSIWFHDFARSKCMFCFFLSVFGVGAQTQATNKCEHLVFALSFFADFFAGHGVPQRLQILNQLWVRFVHGLFQLQEQVRRVASCETRSSGDDTRQAFDFFVFFPSLSFGGAYVTTCCRGESFLFVKIKIEFVFSWNKARVFQGGHVFNMTRQFVSRHKRSLCCWGTNS